MTLQSAPSTSDVGSTVTTQRANAPGVEELTRLASLGALGTAVAVPLVTALTFVCALPLTVHWPEAVVATGLYLPLHVRHVVSGLRGEQPRALRWTLLAMAVVIVGFTPLLGAFWLYAYSALAASLLVTTRTRTSLPLLTVILVAVGIWGAHVTPLVGRAEYIYLPAAVLERAMMVFVPVWLVGALRRVHAARSALADEAVATERRHVDDELEKTVGTALEQIARRARRSLAAMSNRDQVADDELRALTEGSRHALAVARRVIRRYQLIPSFVELENAVSLLRAAGVDASVELPQRELPSALEDATRSSLRDLVADLLHEQPTGPVVLQVTDDNGHCAVSVRRQPSTERVA